MEVVDSRSTADLHSGDCLGYRPPQGHVINGRAKEGAVMRKGRLSERTAKWRSAQAMDDSPRRDGSREQRGNRVGVGRQQTRRMEGPSG